MPTANEQLLDADITHQVELEAYKNGVVSRMLALMSRVDADLVAQLTIALDRMPASQFNIDRLESLLSSVRAINANLYSQLTNNLQAELKDFAEYEANYQGDLFKTVLPPQVLYATVVPEQVYTAALSRPFQGKLLSEWMQSLEETQAVKVRDAVRMGYVENQTIDQIVKRIRGTKALNYRDGVLHISKNNANTIIRSAIAHMAASTKDAFYEANDDLIKAWLWDSTLDGRTTDECIARDHKQYTATSPHRPIGHKLAWRGGPGRLHLGCRSSKTAILKSWQELGLNIEVSPSTRASMDGQVPDKIAYPEWLKKKPASFQDEVLGKTKGKLFREGMPIDRFVNNQGVTYTLDELRKRDAEYFERAGL